MAFRSQSFMAFLTCPQDSDTNPNTTESSVAGDAAPADGRRRRSEAVQMRKSILGKKHGRLDESKVWEIYAWSNALPSC